MKNMCGKNEDELSFNLEARAIQASPYHRQPWTKLLRQIRLFSNIDALIGHCKTCTNFCPPHPHTNPVVFKTTLKEGRGRTDTYAVV